MWKGRPKIYRIDIREKVDMVLVLGYRCRRGERGHGVDLRCGVMMQYMPAKYIMLVCRFGSPFERMCGRWMEKGRRLI